MSDKCDNCKRETKDYINDAPLEAKSYYNVEHDNYYCTKCRKGMGMAYYLHHSGSVPDLIRGLDCSE